MCGNPVIPIFKKDTLEIFLTLGSTIPNMWLSMNTNAGARDEAWWTELALSLVEWVQLFLVLMVLAILIICTGKVLFGTM